MPGARERRSLDASVWAAPAKAPGKSRKRTSLESAAPLLGIYEQMLRIRRCEEKSLEMHAARQIPGNLHPYIGQEAVAAGACACLRPDDYIVSTHRGHGHVLAQGRDDEAASGRAPGQGDGLQQGQGRNPPRPEHR